MTDKARLSNAAKRPEARAPGAEIRHAASIVIGLSGGVDSSVAALLLLRQGPALRAVFMKNWEEDDKDGHCSAAQDLADARAVSEQLGIPLTAVNFAAEYWERVFEQFLAELRAGRTPNPDVLCNREIKFKAFLDYALSLGAERIATGHYARVRETAAGFQLLKGVDPGKDQSYFLYLLGQEALSRTLFPLGELTKPQVRELAAQAGLATRAKKDSTGICFIGERDFKTFLTPYLKPRPGPIRSWEGEELGLHQGLVYYTLGQRQGLGIGGRQGGSGTPWYVVAKDLANDTLVVAQGHDHPALYSRTLEAGQVHWIAGTPPLLPLRCHAKTRYRQADQACCISPEDQDLLSVRFDAPQWAVTPGQSVVFYQGQVCLGGAIIERTSP